MNTIKRNAYHIGQLCTINMRPLPPMSILSICYDIDNRVHIYSLVDNPLSPRLVVTDIPESELVAFDSGSSQKPLTNTLEYERGYNEAAHIFVDVICSAIHQYEHLGPRQWPAIIERTRETARKMVRESGERIVQHLNTSKV